MSTIFISHSSADNALAQDLKLRLERQNHACVFLDFDPTQGIRAGRSWERTLYRKLRACRVVIAICTESYLKSQWCFAEIALARMEGKPIFALLADPLPARPALPSILSEKQFIDLRTDPETGYDRLWRDLGDLDLLGAIGTWEPGKPPYLGLNAYHEEHAPVFFGRETEIRQGIELLDRGAPGLVAVLGASGCGKSSLVRAGIVPRLRRDPDNWLILGPFRPGSDPLAQVAQAIADGFRRHAPRQDPAACDPARIRDLLIDESHAPTADERASPQAMPAPDQRLQRLMAELENLKGETEGDRDPRLRSFLDLSLKDLKRMVQPGDGTEPPGARDAPGLPGLLERLRAAAKKPSARVLIVIDQFEELLVENPGDSDAGRLLGLLADALRADPFALKICITMRSDFLETFQRQNASLQMDFETLSLGPIATDGRRQVIEGPARLGAIELEPGLADRLFEDSVAPDALPLLSYTLWLLWRDCQAAGLMTHAAYDRFDGLAGAVAREADAIAQTHAAKARAADLAVAFRAMVRLADDGQFARQPVAWDAADLVPVHDLLETFIARRLLVLRGEGGTRMLELAHEALIRSWRPLRGWIDDHRAELVLRQQLLQSSDAWLANGRREDDLWRGARLAQAMELVESRKLSGTRDQPAPVLDFVAAGERLRLRQARRRRVAVVCVTVALLLFSAYAVWNEDVAKRAERASWARERAIAATNMLPTDPVQGLAMARDAVCLTQAYDGIVLPEAHDALNEAVGALKRQQTLAAHERAVLRIGFMARRAAEAQESAALISIGADHRARLWSEPDTAQDGCRPLPERLDLGGAATQFAIAPSGLFLAVGDTEGRVTIQDPARPDRAPQPLPDLSVPAGIRDMIIAPNGSRIAILGTDGSLRLAGLAPDGAISGVVALQPDPDPVLTLALTSDGRGLATGTRAGRVDLRDAGTGTPIFSFDAHDEAVTALGFRDDILASASWDQTLRLWDLQTGRLLQNFVHDGVVSDLMFLAAGAGMPRHIVSASWDNNARIWDIDSGALVSVLVHDAPVTTLAQGPVTAGAAQTDGTAMLASASWDGAVWLWTLAPGTPGRATPKLVARHEQAVTDLAFAPDGGRLASAGDDGQIRITRLGSPEGLQPWQSSLDLARYAVAGGDPALAETSEAWVAAITARGVQLLDVTSGTAQTISTGPAGVASEIAFSAEGARRLAISGTDIHEYYLDTRELMLCADRIAPQPDAPGSRQARNDAATTGTAPLGPSEAEPEQSLSDLCRAGRRPGYGSLMSRVTSLLGGFR